MESLLIALIFLALTPVSLSKLIRWEFSEVVSKEVTLPFLHTLILLSFLSGIIFLKNIASPVIIVLLYGNFLLAYTDIYYTLLSPSILYGQFILMSGITLISPADNPFFWWPPVFFYVSFCLLSLIVPNGFGKGDVKLLCIWSCFVDFISVWQIIFFATILALAYILLLNAFRKKITVLPFVPFLYVGLVCVLML